MIHSKIIVIVMVIVIVIVIVIDMTQGSLRHPRFTPASAILAQAHLVQDDGGKVLHLW